jgi:hypothetical protein
MWLSTALVIVHDFYYSVRLKLAPGGNPPVAKPMLALNRGASNYVFLLCVGSGPVLKLSFHSRRDTFALSLELGWAGASDSSRQKIFCLDCIVESIFVTPDTLCEGAYTALKPLPVSGGTSSVFTTK